MGFGNDPEGADSAGFGTVTTWVKPAGEITYTGTLTVGYYEDLNLYGYASGWGSLNPSSSIWYYINYYVGDNNVEGYGYPGLAIFLNSEINITSFKVNSTTFTNFITDGLMIIVIAYSNPFPAVGQTCSIEIKYTFP